MSHKQIDHAKLIVATLDEAAARLENRSAYLRSIGLRNEAGEALYCADVIRNMQKTAEKETL